MSSTDQYGNDREMRGILGEWKVSESLPPRFSEQVWRRIAKMEESGSASAWRLLCDWIARALARPSLAFSYVTALVVVGLLAAYLEGSRQNMRTDQELRARYVQLMSPYRTGH